MIRVLYENDQLIFYFCVTCKFPIVHALESVLLVANVDTFADNNQQFRNTD